MLVACQPRTSQYSTQSLVVWWKLPCTIIHGFAIGALEEIVSTQHNYNLVRRPEIKYESALQVSIGCDTQ